MYFFGLTEWLGLQACLFLPTAIPADLENDVGLVSLLFVSPFDSYRTGSPQTQLSTVFRNFMCILEKVDGRDGKRKLLFCLAEGR